MIYLTLFYTFFLIGLFTFGGGYAMIPLLEEKVLLHSWLSEEEFLNMVGIAESTPGPVAVNMATFVGYKVSGVLGSLVSTLGVILPSFIIILLIILLLKKLLDYPVVKAILSGFQAVVIGLIFATALFFMYKNLFYISDDTLNIAFEPVIIFGVLSLLIILFRIIFKKKMSPYIVLIIGAVLGIIVYSITTFMV